MAEITLEHISKRFADGTAALHDTSFTIPDGEFFVLVGPSGCGKSTLLNLIVGLEKPTSGEIRVDGKVITTLDPRQRNMAMVFQSYAIYPHMTVRENLAFPLKLARLSGEEIDRRVEQAAAILELGALLGRKPASLSGGQRQRVAMGRAIVRQPAAFLMDEPLSNLDARLRGQMRTEIARLQRRLGTTTVYVTHDQTEAMTLGERIAVLRGGEVQQIGTPQALYHHPRNLFVAGFIGAPAMNLLPAELQGDRLRLPMVELDLPAALRQRLPREPRRLIAGIRPEHLRDVDLNGVAVESGAVFELTVEVAEWLGSDLFVYGAFPGTGAAPLPSLPSEAEIASGNADRPGLTARVDPASRVREGERLRLQIDSRRLHLFDAASGENLYGPGDST
jgi:multiple sugar transport system ATP-binding protein